MPQLFRWSLVPVLPGRLLLRGAAALGVALLLAGGSLVGAPRSAHASGAGCMNPAPTYWVHTSTSANTSGNVTDLGYDCTSGFLFVQPIWTRGRVAAFDAHPVGVGLAWKSGDVWAIANVDGAPMPLGVSFLVYDLPESVYPDDLYAFFLQVASDGTYITYLNSPEVNNNPSAHLMVTPDFGYGGEVVDPHQIGIWYDSSVGRWTIYNEDLAPIPVGTEFNVLVVPQRGLFPDAFTQVATSANTVGDSTCINSPLSNQNPNAYLFVTHIYSGYFPDVPGTWYNTSLGEWCVFNGSYQAMPLGAEFSVALPPD